MPRIGQAAILDLQDQLRGPLSVHQQLRYCHKSSSSISGIEMAIKPWQCIRHWYNKTISIQWRSATLHTSTIHHVCKDHLKKHGKWFLGAGDYSCRQSIGQVWLNSQIHVIVNQMILWIYLRYYHKMASCYVYRSKCHLTRLVSDH